MAIPKLPADSPRFAYYVSRWDVPGKIAAARAAGTLDDLLKDCPPIDPAWTRFVPAALEAWREFKAKYMRPKGEQPQSSSKRRRAV
jgi:hypothetical protein